MKRILLLACLPMAPLAAQADDPIKFLSKDRIEKPILERTDSSALVLDGTDPARLEAFPDVSKMALESEIKHSIGAGPAELGLPDGVVQPGLVRWHASYALALEASRASGKPVLLFQLLGRLDEEFC